MAVTSSVLSVLISILTLMTRVECGYSYSPPSFPGFVSSQQYPESSAPYSIYTQNSPSNYHQSPSSNIDSASWNAQGSHLNGINLNSISAASVQPIVTKHVYFHVPPPDVEASVTPAPYKKKKTYNIVFIKVPSLKHYSSAQSFSSNRYVPVEDKTLIYVLVKKPEVSLQESVKPAPTHEVYYVKYKGNAANAASQINAGLSQVPHAITEQALRPGLVNGRI